MATMHNPPHPGLLVKETMEELNLSTRALAKESGGAPSTVQRTFAGKSDISPEMAIRLSVVIGSSEYVWLGMQNDYDLWQARQVVDVSQLHRLQTA
ncbi:HigA family addiction module antitoxin [Ewingella sp. AOP9-I1-14]